jgi:hypothetical protein
VAVDESIERGIEQARKNYGEYLAEPGYFAKPVKSLQIGLQNVSWSPTTTNTSYVNAAQIGRR